MQLELLLDSISKHDINKHLDVSVLYTVSNSDFDLGYEKLSEKYSGLHWYKEVPSKNRFVLPLLPLYWHNYFWWFKYKYNRWIASDFKSKVISILEDNKNELVMFLTDDSMFVKKIEIDYKASSQVIKKGRDYSFSLRHGKNISGGIFTEDKNSIYWNRTDKHSNPDWSYAFSVD